MADYKEDEHHYPYEPTPYIVLERLANAGYITKKNTVLDYGCGKGRVDFFLSYQTRCKTIGIEYNERIYQSAVENKVNAVSGNRTIFLLENAESYKVPVEVDCIYFFNPFSVEILQKVIARIKESYYEAPREMLLFFYYSSKEYIAYLMTVREFSFLDEISCIDLFNENKEREKIIVFEII